MFTLQTFSIKQLIDCDSPFTIMDPLSCGDAVYEDVKAESSHEGFNIHENKCYGKVASGSIYTTRNKQNHSYIKFIIMAFVIVLVLLLGTACACVAFAVQITLLKSEIASLEMASSTSFEEVGHQLNTSVDMQLRQQNDSIYQLHQLNEGVHQQLNTSINMINLKLQELIMNKVMVANNPATSCKDLYVIYNASSGYYWIGEAGFAALAYCNMSLTCGDLTGGWMRVANIDMTDTSQNCPSGLDLIASPRRLCDTTVDGCASSDFNVHGAQYSHICGRIIGYQRRVPLAFADQRLLDDDNCVYGVSLTHGQIPREHIWTFAGSLDESSSYPSWKCPCINTNIGPSTVPSYIGSDYFCDTALSARYDTVPNYDSIHVSDPLWDGEGCGSTNTCCYDPQREVNPPWFVKTLSSPTTDDIEMRLCPAAFNSNGGTPIEIVELYVH